MRRSILAGSAGCTDPGHPTGTLSDLVVAPVGVISSSAMQVQTSIAAPIETVWEHLSDLGEHPRWMADAESLEFATDQRQGVGTRLRVMTRVGPLRVADDITISGWIENRLIAVDHHGSVSGTGRFELTGDGAGTTLAWTENLQFPWWMGGTIGHLAASPILRRIWTGNLGRFKESVEAGS